MEAMKVRVCKRVSFDAAHRLPNYVGKCANWHGHHWVVELAVSGQIMEEYGFVVDFSRLKDWLKENVVDVLDHTSLNDTIENPTAENLALYIKELWKSSGQKVLADINLDFIRVWETEDSYVEVGHE